MEKFQKFDPFTASHEELLDASKYREKVMEYYRKRTALKGVAGSEHEYQQSKVRFYSTYGMMVSTRTSTPTAGATYAP